MSFTAEINRRPEEVLELLSRRLFSERGDSWGKSYVLTSSTDRVYVRVTGREFQASRHAGRSMFGAVASGTINGTSGGTTIDVQFRFGIAPVRFPLALLVISLIAAIVGMLRLPESIGGLFAWAAIPAVAGLYWWQTRWEVRVILEELGKTLGGVSWRGPSS